MVSYRCKCGRVTSQGSMSPAPCQSCPDCGSDLASSPSTHRDPIEHDYGTMYDQHTGEPYERCRRCTYRRIEIEERRPEAAS